MYSTQICQFIDLASCQQDCAELSIVSDCFSRRCLEGVAGVHVAVTWRNVTDKRL